MALLWICFNSSTSFICWGPQTWMQYSRLGFTRVEQKGTTTSFTLLAREAAEVERYNRLHPTAKPQVAYLNEVLSGKEGPIVVSTDYIRAYPDQIRAYLPKDRDMLVLGTDGYGRSDTREALRRHFEVNRYHVVVAALKSLADQGKVQAADVQKAIEKYGIETETQYPLYR